jgi:hypothetical protein
MDELSQHFHLPEKAVARQLGVCLTSLKKICRQNGIQRWPYRKLKSLDKKISKIESALHNSAEDPSALLYKWEMLKMEKKNLPFSNSNEDSDAETRKRITTVANASGHARSKISASPSSSVGDDSWNQNSPSSITSSSSSTGHSGADTPVQSRPVERNLRKSSKSRRPQYQPPVESEEEDDDDSDDVEILDEPAAVNSPTVSSPAHQPPRAPRPEQLELNDESLSPDQSSDEEVEPLVQEESVRLADYYCRTDSARYYGRNSMTSAFLEDSFRVPIFSPTVCESEVFNFYSNSNPSEPVNTDFFSVEDPVGFY